MLSTFTVIEMIEKLHPNLAEFSDFDYTAKLDFTQHLFPTIVLSISVENFKINLEDGLSQCRLEFGDLLIINIPTILILVNTVLCSELITLPHLIQKRELVIRLLNSRSWNTALTFYFHFMY